MILFELFVKYFLVLEVLKSNLIRYIKILVVSPNFGGQWTYSEISQKQIMLWRGRKHIIIANIFYFQALA